MVVVSDGNPEGVLSEQDLIREIVNNKKYHTLRFKVSRYAKFEEISLETNVLQAAHTIRERSRLLKDNKLVGIATATDLVGSFRKTYVA